MPLFFNSTKSPSPQPIIKVIAPKAKALV
ncbi:pseudouridine synthase, partial [Campylobacter coli]|nr:pseudouridine synthase [Campylobacter coli]